MAFYPRFSNRLVRYPRLSTGLSRAHAALFRRTGGRAGRKFLGRRVLVLRTVGRRSGKVRESPMWFLRDGASYVVVASNGGSPQTPAWFHNARAAGGAEVVLEGRTEAVDVRQADEAEAARLWPRLHELYAGFEQYRSYADRELPIAILTPRS